MSSSSPGAKRRSSISVDFPHHYERAAGIWLHVHALAVPSDWGPSVTKYRYVYSNDRVMLVDPATRTVVHEID
jgi:hypothetical protein